MLVAHHADATVAYRPGVDAEIGVGAYLGERRVGRARPGGAPGSVAMMVAHPLKCGRRLGAAP